MVWAGVKGKYLTNNFCKNIAISLAVEKYCLTVYTYLYILSLGVTKMATAKIFNSGNSQAVRLPKEYRFQTEEVGIQKVGESIILYPKESAINTFIEGLNSFSDDFLSEGREHQINKERDGL